MPPNKRKPPGGYGGLSRNVVVADGLDIFRDNLLSPKKQPDPAGLVRAIALQYLDDEA